MKTIRNWYELRPYGIDMLTGEACGYGYRLLCDVNPDGQRLLNEALGVRSIAYHDGWNNSRSGSVMLPREMFTPLAIFALFTVDNCSRVFVTYDGIVYGVEATDEQSKVDEFVKRHQGEHCRECNRYGKGGGINLTYANPGFSRNKHQMSGRTE